MITHTIRLLTVTAVIAASGCSFEYSPTPETDSAGITDFVFSEDADPSVARLDYAKTQLLVQPYPGAEGDRVNAAIAAAGATIVGGLAEVDVTLLSTAENNLARASASLEGSGLFEMIHKNYTYTTGRVPTDPTYVRQAYLAQINLERAWDLATGSSQAIIAIVDTGVDSGHPELTGKVVGGWSVDNAGGYEDVLGHGTAVAGVAAASANNATGIAGVAWDSQILSVRVGNRFGESSSSNIAAGILWAAGNGAKVINVSFAPLWGDRVIRSAAQSAFNRGSLVIVSAGNAGGLSQSSGYDEALFVGALDHDVLAPFSDRGPFVDLAAPGVAIRVTEMGGAYGVMSGTSFSAPIVSGVAALMWSVNDQLRPAILRQLLLDTAVDLGSPGRDTSFGEGRIDAFAAVDAAIAIRDAIDATPPSLTLVRPIAGASMQGRYVVAAEAADASGIAEVVLSIDGLPHANDTRSPYLFVVDTNAFDAGEHEVALIAVDHAGNQSEPIVLTVPFLWHTDQTSRAGSIRFRAPADGAAVSGDVLIQATVSDRDGLSVIEWLVNNESVHISSLAGESTGVAYLWRGDQAGDGEHRISIRLTDAAGQPSMASISLTRG